MPRTTVNFLWRNSAITSGFRSGVTLHSHTSHSWENLSWLSGYRSQFPGLELMIKLADWQHRSATRQRLDLGRAFWKPPLAPAEALRVEQGQIHGLGLPALVSLTDHDDLESGLALLTIRNSRKIAVSLEWTAPFGPTFFHIGVHNLPPESARATAAVLAEYRARPDEERLPQILEWLNEAPGTLIILNHPLWDEAGIGAEGHMAALGLLLDRTKPWIHALEINGLRSWGENRRAIELAEAYAMPVVGGGDRHGLEPNAILNLSRARGFAEFVEEVRHGGVSDVLVMPQYREALRLRWLETLKDIFRPYETATGELSRWTSRFFYEGEDGVRRPLSELWQGTRHDFLQPLFAFLRISDSRHLRPALRFMLGERTGAIPA
jgi:hypothetical protein